MAKKTMVPLVVEIDGKEQKKEFTISVAEKLLRMTNNGGWKLPSDSHYIMTAHNGLEYRANTEESKGAKKSASNKQGKDSSEQD